ncbi:MAG TPA: hypothetical protein VMU78_06110 [Methylocella sp.]|nr:hypothetical protein [Methylocella sp.]
MIKTQMMTQLSFTVAGVVFATVALGFTAVGQLPSFPFRETILVRIANATGTLSNRIYCKNGENGQYSEVHRGWVCPTEPAPFLPN